MKNNKSNFSCFLLFFHAINIVASLKFHISNENLTFFIIFFVVMLFAVFGEGVCVIVGPEILLKNCGRIHETYWISLLTPSSLTVMNFTFLRITNDTHVSSIIMWIIPCRVFFNTFSFPEHDQISVKNLLEISHLSAKFGLLVVDYLNTEEQPET